MSLKEILRKYPVIRESIYYVIIGGISTVAEIASFYFLRKTGMGLYLSNFFGKNIGITLSFLLNTYINFKVRDKLLKRFLSFFAVGYAGLGISNFVLYIGVEQMGRNEMIVKAVSVLVAGTFQFLINKFLTFRKTNVK